MSNITVVLIIVVSSFIYLFSSLILEKENHLKGNIWLPHLLLGTGFLLTMFQEIIAPAGSIILANMLIFTGFLEYIHSTSNLLSRRYSYPAALILLLLFLSGFIYFTYFSFNTIARIIILGAAIGISGTGYSVQLYIQQRNTPDKHIIPFITLFGAMGFVSFIRIFHTLLLNNNITSFLSPNSSSFFSLLFMLIFIRFWNLLYHGTRLLIAQGDLQNQVSLQKSLLHHIEGMHAYLQEIGKKGSPEEFYPLIFSTMTEILFVDEAALYLYDSDARRLIMVASTGLKADYIEMAGNFRLTDNTVSVQAFNQRDLIVRKTEDFPEGPIKAALHGRGIQKTISIAVMTGETPVGALSAGLRSEEPLSENDLEILKMLGSQSGTALHNLKLYETITSSESKYRAIFQTAGESIFIFDHDGTILDANAAALREFGYSLEELSGMGMSRLYATDSMTDLYNITGNSNTTISRTSSSESMFITRTGTSVHVWITQSAIVFDGKPAVLSVVRDITERKDREKLLTREARTDFLTGALNRRAFEDQFTREFKRKKRYSRPMSVMILDVDDFKQINDTYGHEAGDCTLKALVQIINNQLRESDLFARFGGEEFIIAMPESDREGSCRLGERIRAAVEEASIRAGDAGISCTVSAGITEIESHDTEIAEVIARADKALYKAKTSGKNRVVSL